MKEEAKRLSKTITIDSYYILEWNAQTWTLYKEARRAEGRDYILGKHQLSEMLANYKYNLSERK